ncbi:MAG: type II toxin-antitoxin system HigB family toxin [Alphaproteobacteria bacterium]|nr:type II toxin-antitoxin system HigB family toxin [Alphaproteobacteria bacterium]
MRILKRIILNDCAQKYNEIEAALKVWFWQASKNNWLSSNDLLNLFPKAKILEKSFFGQDQVCFELKSNSYYLIAVIHYPSQCLLLKGITSDPKFYTSFSTFKEPAVNIKPIRSHKDYEKALAVIDEIWPAEEDTEEYEHFEVLVNLIESYEQKHWNMEFPDPISALQFYMNQQDKSVDDLGALLGSAHLALRVLSYDEPLTLSMINQLCAVWKIPAECLIKPYQYSV